MTSVGSFFSAPRWRECARRVLDQAQGRCEECGSVDRVAVYACSWDGRSEPWELPRTALRAYCAAHREQRRRLEREMRHDLSSFGLGELEVLHGALSVLEMLPEQERAIAIDRVYAEAKRARFDAE